MFILNMVIWYLGGDVITYYISQVNKLNFEDGSGDESPY